MPKSMWANLLSKANSGSGLFYNSKYHCTSELLTTAVQEYYIRKLLHLRHFLSLMKQIVINLLLGMVTYRY